MKKSRWFALAALCTSFAWLLAGGCSAGAGDDDNGVSRAGTGGSLGDAQSGGNTSSPDATGTGGTAASLNPLCGTGDCLPDNANACRDYEPPGVGGAPGHAGAAGQENGGAAGESNGGASGGEAGATQVPAGGEGGASGDGGRAGEAGNAGESSGGAGGGAGNGGSGGDATTPSRYSCQVQRQNNEPIRHCELAGTGVENGPCFSSADCAAGLGCVADGDAGRCLRYCCSPNTSCGTGTYCAERQLRKAGADTNNAEPARVPVCVPADGCSLDEAFPCQGAECRCTGKTACMLVRDKTTTCIEPGSGQQGEACPCAWNHLCSSVTNQCVKICHTDPSKNECGSQKCQASSELPPNFGVCVGPLP
jgi:hypothetical protein